MANLFISYSRTDESAVRALAHDFEAIGHNVWLDHELTGGQSWWDEILRRIRECDLFVFALSPSSMESTACKREYRYAEALGKQILPVLLADGVSLTLLPPALSAIQYVDYRKPDRNAALSLARTVLNLPPPPALPDVLPEPPEVPISYLAHLKDQVDSSGILNFNEQAALAFRLKEHLADPAVADDVQNLMRRFRARPDLLARVAEEIDGALATASDLGGASSGAPSPPPVSPGASVGGAAAGTAWKPGQRPAQSDEAAASFFDADAGRSAERDGARRRGDRRGEERREGERRGGERRGGGRRAERRAPRRPREGGASSSGRGRRIVGGLACGFFALSALGYTAESGDPFGLAIAIALAVAAYKLIRG